MAAGLRGITEADTFPGWNPQVLARQLAGERGMGASGRHGPRPLTADEVAPRGTPEWRAARERMNDWVQKQLFTGASLADLGFANEREHGKQKYGMLERGEFAGFRPDWFQAAKGSGRYYIDPYTGQRRATGGGAPMMPSGGGLGSSAMRAPAPGTGLGSGAPTGYDANAPAPQASYAPAGATTAPSPTYTASDSYAQFPRGGRGRRPSVGPGAGGGPSIDPNATLIRRIRNPNATLIRRLR